MSNQQSSFHRWEILNHWRSQTHRNKRLGLVPKIKNWIFYYFKGRFIKCSYPVYSPSGNNGIFKMPNHVEEEEEKLPIRIGMVADWASNSTESDRIGFLMGQFSDEFIANDQPFNPIYETPQEPVFAKSAADYTIHLGDTYYVGEKYEIEENFGKNSSWHYGQNSAK